MGGAVPGDESPPPEMSSAEQKHAAAVAAAAMVEDGMVLGLGTGTTATLFVSALGPLRRDIQCVATSRATAAQAQALGMRVSDLDAVGEIDLTIDGADEVTRSLGLIKGGGGALLREKLVWEASRRRVVIADATKLVERLGRFPLPIEVVEFGHATTARRIERALDDHGLRARPRLRLADGAPARTDGGNVIYDVPCGHIPDAPALATALKTLTGVVEHGLFLNLAQGALIGGDDGVLALGDTQ